MFSRIGLLVTAGALAVAVMSLPAFAGAARDRAAVTTEFSAQAAVLKEDPRRRQERRPSHRRAQAGGAARHSAPGRAGRRRPRRVSNRRGNSNHKRNSISQKKFDAQKNVGPKVVAPVTVTPGVVSPKSGTSNQTRKVYTPRGNNSRVVVAAKIRSAPVNGAFRTSIRGRNYSVWRSGYRVRHGDRWQTFVALSALGVLAIGAAEYYPYAYIDAPPEYCDGLTEDGCQMVFDEVETMEGDLVGQCVAYCPWR